MSVLALKGVICSNYKCFEIKLSNPLLAIAKKITCAKLELKKLNILKSSFNLEKKFFEIPRTGIEPVQKGFTEFFLERFGSGSVQEN